MDQSYWANKVYQIGLLTHSSTQALLNNWYEFIAAKQYKYEVYSFQEKTKTMQGRCSHDAKTWCRCAKLNFTCSISVSSVDPELLSWTLICGIVIDEETVFDGKGHISIDMNSFFESVWVKALEHGNGEAVDLLMLRIFAPDVGSYRAPLQGNVAPNTMVHMCRSFTWCIWWVREFLWFLLFFSCQETEDQNPEKYSLSFTAFTVNGNSHL